MLAKKSNSALLDPEFTLSRQKITSKKLTVDTVFPSQKSREIGLKGEALESPYINFPLIISNWLSFTLPPFWT